MFIHFRINAFYLSQKRNSACFTSGDQGACEMGLLVPVLQAGKLAGKLLTILFKDVSFHLFHFLEGRGWNENVQYIQINDTL
jgi:hypothetical protein